LRHDEVARVVGGPDGDLGGQRLGLNLREGPVAVPVEPEVLGQDEREVLVVGPGEADARDEARGSVTTSTRESTKT
jgi:hypothetical protein